MKQQQKKLNTMNIALNRVYRFEIPTIQGNIRECRYVKTIFQNGSFFINLYTYYFDNDNNVIKGKNYYRVSEEDFDNFLGENENFLIEQYSF